MLPLLLYVLNSQLLVWAALTGFLLGFILIAFGEHIVAVSAILRDGLNLDRQG